jgi:hypothetical protein
MKKTFITAGLILALAACSKNEAPLSDAKPTAVEPVATSGAAAAAPNSTAPSAAPKAEEAKKDAAPAADPTPAFREVTIPAGTMLKLNLTTGVASDSSKVEDAVRATLRSPITIGNVEALPAGTTVTGHVTDVARPGKVKGRARIGFRFTRLDPPGSAESMQIRTASYSRIGEGSKKRDAATIGGGAVGGAIVGGLIGGKDGAAKGAAIGGAGGTGVVLATRGKDVSVAAGSPIAVRLTAPLTLRVPVR